MPFLLSALIMEGDTEICKFNRVNNKIKELFSEVVETVCMTLHQFSNTGLS